MKSKVILIIFVFIILIAIVIGTITLFKSDFEIFNRSLEDEIYVNIVQNGEKSEELKLNTDNTTNYYYFKITNYNTEISKYNQTEVTPYIKLDFENKTDILKWKLFKVDSIEDSEENWKEITEKGESETSFAEYYKCQNLLPYEEKNENEHNYVLKIELNSESEDFINLEEDINSNFSIVLGYKEVK